MSMTPGPGDVHTEGPIGAQSAPHEPSVAVCQVCGRAAAVTEKVKKDWHISPHKKLPGVHIVRCPNHISEWALRHSQAGRTAEMRKKAARGREMVLPPVSAIDPMPTDFVGAAGPTGASQGVSEGGASDQDTLLADAEVDMDYETDPFAEFNASREEAVNGQQASTTSPGVPEEGQV